MRLTTLLTLFLTLQMSASVWSQNMSVKLKNSTLQEMFVQIEKSSNYRFFYNNDEVDVNHAISIDVEEKPVGKILSAALKGTPYSFKEMENRLIMIERASRQGNPSGMDSQQAKSISGNVTETTGGSLPGVSVVIKGTTIGTVTDFDGNYSLANVPANATLQFSFVGMKTQEVAVGGKTTVNVVLAEEAIGLEEVVAVGYGTQKKVNLTGSVAAVNAASIESRPVPNISTALQGIMPGATIIQTSGQPGKDMSSINIRGIGTLNNANPMYVVDGMVVSEINDIDPNDIESISVLKDAASSAIYGSRASNGVILVTTKKGSNKEATLKYDGYVGWEKPTNLIEYLPSWEYAKLYNQARINQNLLPAYTDAEIQKFRDGTDPDNYPNTDWSGMFYKNSGFQQSHRAELTGGSDNTTYMFSLGYFDQGGIIDLANFKRYNARTNLTSKFNKITVSLNMAFTYGKTQEPTNPYTGDMYQIFRQINRIAPFVPYKYSNGYYGYIADGNPLAWMDLGATQQEQYRKTRGIGNVTYEPIKGLKFQQLIGYEYTGSSDEKFIKDIQFYNWKTGDPSFYQGPNSQTDKRTDNQVVSTQTLITYDKKIGKHGFNLLAGYSQEYNRTDWNSSYRKNFLNNNLSEINAGSTDGQVAEGSAYEFGLRSYFGRISYDFADKYLFEANIRHDGTSRIVKENQWGTFPSFSAGWRIINEPFMGNLKHIFSDLKIRVGWGILGNQNLNSSDKDNNPYGGYYPYQSVLAAANYDFGGIVSQGVAPVDGVNNNIKWESSKTTNLGVDLAFLASKLTMNIDWYQRNTYDILMTLPVPSPFGLTAPNQNAAEVMNEGIEFQIGYKLAIRDIKFNIQANAAYNKNEITNLHNDGAKIWEESLFQQEGYPVKSFGGYIAEGLFRTQEDLDNSAVVNRAQAGLGDLKYKDINNDKIINAEDRTYLGSWTPAWTFGSTLGASWKGFDLSLFFQGAAKVKGFVQRESVGELTGNTSKPTSLFLDSYDQVSNPNGNFPRPLTSWSVNSSGIYPSSFWIYDASYVRLKNVQLGYTIPSDISKKAGLSKIKIYYSGQNLLTFTGVRKGIDPEAPAAARAYYPQVKTNSIGLSVIF